MLSLVLLAGFVAYGPQISTAVGGMLAEQLTKDPTPPAACDENPAEGSRRGAAGPDQQAGQAGETGPGKSQKERAGKAPAGDAGRPETRAASPDC